METIIPSSTARRNFVIASLLFHWGIIVAILLKGEPTNSLHTSALAWAFAMSAATFGAYVFGAVWDNRTLSVKSS